MAERITIQEERNNNSRWLKVYIPSWAGTSGKASIQSPEGVVLKRVHLIEGNNAIDISSITAPAINIKVETSFETILVEITPES